MEVETPPRTPEPGQINDENITWGGFSSESCGAALPLGLRLESSGSLRCLSRLSLCSLQLFSAALSAEMSIYSSISLLYCLSKSTTSYQNKQNIHALDHKMKCLLQTCAALAPS